MDKHDLTLTPDSPAHELELVDLDDLRAAFGQGELPGAPDAAAVPPPEDRHVPELVSPGRARVALRFGPPRAQARSR